MADCVLCGREQADVAYACSDCAGRYRRACHDIATAATGARDVANGQARRGPAVAGGSSEGRLPINLSARARLDAATNAVTTWARHVSETRGEPVTDPPRHIAGPACRSHVCEHRSCAIIRDDPDQVTVAALWLARQTEWIRHRREIEEALPVLERAARIMRSLADGPADRRWLGQCGAPLDDGPCRTDLYARDGAATARCRTCEAEYVVADRRRANAELARGYSYTATEISDAYPEIRTDRIRQWASRGRITSTGPVDGRPAYDLGEVLELAAKEAARLAGEQAKRARRRDAELQSDRELAS